MSTSVAPNEVLRRQRQEVADRLLADCREEILRADSKASILLAGVSVGASALLAGLIAGDWSPTELDNSVEWVWWIGITFTAVAVVQLGLCLLPVLANAEASNRIDYYGDVRRFRTSGELAAALEQGQPDVYGRTVRQIHVCAGIVTRKYSLLRWAMGALVISVGLVVLSLLLNLPA